MAAKTAHPLYTTWSMMMQRCYNARNGAFAYYGGRGIKVCREWADKSTGFSQFLTDMGERPEGMTLDRINNDKDYSPLNCRWASKSTQESNKGLRKDNKLGLRGVQRHYNKYRARMRRGGVSIHLGLFSTPEAAAAAYARAGAA